MERRGSSGREHHLRLDVVVDGGTVTGSISADGGDTRSFHGRLGLITAIDQVLDHLHPPPAPDATIDEQPSSDR